MSCINLRKKEKKTHLKYCEYCGESFHAKRKQVRFCSVSCGNLHRFKDPLQRQKISDTHKSGSHDEGYKKQAETLRQHYQQGIITPWNKGLTSDTDKRVHKAAIEHGKIIKQKYREDAKYRRFQNTHCKKIAKIAGVINRKKRKGKSWVELYGEEKAAIMKKKLMKIEIGVSTCISCGIILTRKNITLLGKKRVRRKAYCRECWKKHMNTVNAIYAEKTWLKIFEALGVTCVKCGFSDLRALQIDHKNGKNEQDKKMKGNTIRYVGRRSIQEIREKYQLLCANCNWIKRYENNESKNNHLNNAKFKSYRVFADNKKFVT